VNIRIVKFKVLTAVRMMIFWVLARVGSSVDGNVSDKHTVSIFRAED
jgi:hypothetical protein